MNRFTSTLLALLLAIAGCAEKKAKEEKKPATPAGGEYALLSKEYNDSQTNFARHYREAKSREEQAKIMREKRPDPQLLVPRFFELAQKAPNDPAAVDALMWVAAQESVPASPGEENLREKALAMLLKDHLQDPKLSAICGNLTRSMDKTSEEILRGLLDKNPNLQTRGLACLCLAKQLQNQLQFADQLNKDPVVRSEATKVFGAARIEEIRKLDPAKQSAQIDALYNRVIKDFGDVQAGNQSTLGKAAEYELFAMHHLAVGKEAPDIEGADSAGNEFKLSEYRGRVVFLDFWGCWCPPCMALVPHGRELVKRLEGQPFALVGVNTDASEKEQKECETKSNINWRSFHDSKRAISQRWQIEGYPTLYLLDARGVIRFKSTGAPPGNELDKKIDELIEETKGKKETSPKDAAPKKADK